MKKLKLMLLILGAAAALQSCKKGEDDPFLSLRSRKARVAGKWKMTSMNSKNTNSYSSYSSVSTFSSDGSTYSSSNTSGGTTTTNSGTYTSNFEFKKDGTFTLTFVEDSVTITETGTWDFNTGVGKTKGKSEIKLNILSYTTPYSSVTISGRFYNETYELKELRNKKMVLTNQYTYASSTDNDSHETTITLEAE